MIPAEFDAGDDVLPELIVSSDRGGEEIVTRTKHSARKQSPSGRKPVTADIDVINAAMEGEFFRRGK